MVHFLSNYLTKLTELDRLKGQQPPAIDRDLNKLIKEVKFFKVYSAYLSILVSVLTTLSNEPNESNLVSGFEKVYFISFLNFFELHFAEFS